MYHIRFPHLSKKKKKKKIYIYIYIFFLLLFYFILFFFFFFLNLVVLFVFSNHPFIGIDSDTFFILELFKEENGKGYQRVFYTDSSALCPH